VLDQTFANNLAKGKAVTASQKRGGVKQFAASNLTDGNYDTYWSTHDGMTEASLTINLGKVTEINRILLQEYIPMGQRVQSFTVEYWEGNKFKKLDRQTTIGYKRILTFPAVKTAKVRINILEAKACPVLSEVQLYKAPELLSLPQITRSKEGKVSISSESADAIVTYTTDGREPLFSSSRYIQPFDLASGGTVKAKAFIKGGKEASETVSITYDLAPQKWSIAGADKDRRLARIIDGDTRTFWVSPQNNGSDPRTITIDLGEKITLKGFSYTPRQDGNKEGIIYQYKFSVSEDGNDWKEVVRNSAFANIKNNPVKQDVRFDRSYVARLIKIEALSTVNENDGQLSIAELGVITR
jgi:alpha-L-fucosidase